VAEKSSVFSSSICQLAYEEKLAEREKASKRSSAVAHVERSGREAEKYGV